MHQAGCERFAPARSANLGLTRMMAIQWPRASFILLFALIGATAQPVLATESYPTRPIRVVVPVPPGAAADVLPRIVAEKMAARLGRPVIIDNRPGANSNIGAAIAASAAPDGYTLLATPPPPLVTNQSLYPRLGFDPAAFAPITVVATVTNVLVASPRAPFSSLQEALRVAAATPGKLTYASAGTGSSPHLAMEWLAQLAGVRMTHVPYNGLAQALTDVLAGRVDMMFNNTANVLPLIKEGKLRAFGVDSRNRLPELSDAPAIAEMYPGYVVTSWFAIVAPPKTRSAICAKLAALVAEALREPDVVRRLRELSATPVGSSPAETAAFIQRERERWHRIIAAGGIKAD